MLAQGGRGEIKGMWRGGFCRGKKDEKMRGGDGRINKEERQHIKCLNPRRALCSSSLSFPSFFPVTLADLSILVTECLITGRGRSILFDRLKRRPPARGCGRAHRQCCTLGNASFTVVLFLLHRCFFFFFL